MYVTFGRAVPCKVLRDYRILINARAITINRVFVSECHKAAKNKQERRRRPREASSDDRATIEYKLFIIYLLFITSNINYFFAFTSAVIIHFKLLYNI